MATYLGRFDLATQAHTGWGLFYICLPMAALALLLWRFLSQDLLALLPARHAQALVRWGGVETSVPPKALRPAAVSWPWMALALLTGAASHMVWDAFTHASGAMVQALPWLQQSVFSWGGREFRVFNLLQHASSLGALLLLLVLYWRAWAQTPPIARPPNPGAPAADQRLRVGRWCALLLAVLGGLSWLLPGWWGQAGTSVAAASPRVFYGLITATDILLVLTIAAALTQRCARLMSNTE